MLDRETQERQKAYEQGRRDGKREVWHLVIFFAMVVSFFLISFWLIWVR